MTTEVTDIVKFAKDAVSKKGKGISMSDVVDLVRDISAIVEHLNTDKDDEYKKKATLEALDAALEGCVIHGAAMSLAPTIIETVYSLPPSKMLEMAKDAAGVLDGGLEAIGVDADVSGALESALDAADDALSVASDAASVAEDVVDLVDDLVDEGDLISVADSVMDAVDGIASGDTEAVADAVKVGARKVMGGCCKIF